MLDYAGRLRQIEQILNEFTMPEDGTYEDMYAQLEGNVIDLIQQLRKSIVGNDLSNRQQYKFLDKV